MMAQDPSARGVRLTVDTLKTQGYGRVAPPPPSSSEGPTTPTSTTAYSNGPGSPYDSSLGSPMSGVSRQQSLWGGRTPGRRLSVPSGASPFPTPSHHPLYPAPYLSPISSSSHRSDGSSHTNSIYGGSPTSSVYSVARYETTAEADRRRRTWHPSTFSGHPRPATSGLSFFQTPDAPRPAFAPQAVTAASPGQRLPGIETFDQMSLRPVTPSPPARRPSPPLLADGAHHRPPLFSGSSDRSITTVHERKGHASWDMSLHQNLTKLDLANGNGTPPTEAGVWGRQLLTEMDSAAAASSSSASAYRGVEGLASSALWQPLVPGGAAAVTHPELPKQKRLSQSDHYPPPAPAAGQALTSRPGRERRQGWYNGPLGGGMLRQQQQGQQGQIQAAAHGVRTSPEDSSSSDGVPTPSATSTEWHPSIVHANGYIERNLGRGGVGGGGGGGDGGGRGFHVC